jgi:alpha-1,2-mannosyltransferase
MFHEVPRDFVVFTESARWLWAGLDPYRELLAQNTPNANPPRFLLATLPLTLVSDRMAFYLWTLGSVLALMFSLWKTATALKFAFRDLLIVALGLQGVSAALRFAQVTLLLLPLMTLAWTADREGRKAAAGGWLGALIYVKPFVGVYALYMLWRREWRTLRSMIGIWVVLAATGLLAGIGVTRSWIETLRAIGEKTSHVVNASWPALVARMFTPDLSQPEPAYRPFIVAPALASVVTIGGVVAIGIISAWAVIRTKKLDVQWAILAPAMLLMSPLGWMYYIPLLIPMLAAVVPSMRRLVFVFIAGAILWVPSSVLARNTFGPLATATIASPYTWGLLLLWATLCFESRGADR